MELSGMIRTVYPSFGFIDISSPGAPCPTVAFFRNSIDGSMKDAVTKGSMAQHVPNGFNLVRTFQEGDLVRCRVEKVGANSNHRVTPGSLILRQTVPPKRPYIHGFGTVEEVTPVTFFIRAADGSRVYATRSMVLPFPAAGTNLNAVLHNGDFVRFIAFKVRAYPGWRACSVEPHISKTGWGPLPTIAPHDRRNKFHLCCPEDVAHVEGCIVTPYGFWQRGSPVPISQIRRSHTANSNASSNAPAIAAANAPGSFYTGNPVPTYNGPVTNNGQERESTSGPGVAPATSQGVLSDLKITINGASQSLSGPEPATAPVTEDSAPLAVRDIPIPVEDEELLSYEEQQAAEQLLAEQASRYDYDFEDIDEADEFIFDFEEGNNLGANQSECVPTASVAKMTIDDNNNICEQQCASFECASGEPRFSDAERILSSAGSVSSKDDDDGAMEIDDFSSDEERPVSFKRRKLEN